MTNEEIHQLVKDEFKNKILGVTEQYLDIHEPVYTNGVIKIDRIDRETGDGIIIAYLPVKGEHFSFAVYIDPVKKEILNIGTESRNAVSLIASSDTLTSNQLSAFTKLTSTNSANKGDIRFKKMLYKNNFVEYEPNPEPDELEDKLKKLLAYLQQDTEGILKLGSKANVYINVAMDFHAGNPNLGCAFISRDIIKKMSDLNLEIQFDFRAWGNYFK